MNAAAAGHRTPAQTHLSEMLAALLTAGKLSQDFVSGGGSVLNSDKASQRRDKVYQLATRKRMQIEHFLRRFLPIHVNLARYLTIESGGKAYPKTIHVCNISGGVLNSKPDHFNIAI